MFEDFLTSYRLEIQSSKLILCDGHVMRRSRRFQERIRNYSFLQTQVRAGSDLLNDNSNMKCEMLLFCAPMLFLRNFGPMRLGGSTLSMGLTDGSARH